MNSSLFTRILAVFAFFLFINTLFSQTNITFRIDMQDLADSGLFFSDDRVVLRGMFNDWLGTNWELDKDNEDAYTYSKTFEIMMPPGDHTEYKYVIISADGKEYWEGNPNPDNPPHGNRTVEHTEYIKTLELTSFVAGEDIKGRKLPWLDRFRADFAEGRKILEENHPALYDYSSKETLDAQFDHYYSLINEDTDYSTFYQYLSRVMALIGCGHTKLFIPKYYWESQADRFFPLQLLINKDEVLVKGTLGEGDDIPLGSKLLSINGMKLAGIIDQMLPLQSSDGFMTSFKYYTIEKRFPEIYAMLYGFPEKFSISYIPPGESGQATKSLSPASFEQVKVVWPVRDELSFNTLDKHNAALMTINTFGYYAEVPMFRAFIDSSFLVLKDKNISNLIIDLRGNDGGDPYCASYLFSYLQKESVPYFIKSYHHYDTLSKPMFMPENHYSGKVFVLIDGGGFSTTGHLCGLLGYHDLVTFVGTDLGATYTCTGNVMYPQLTNTQLYLGSAKVTRYTTAVKDMDPMVPVKADHFVETTSEDLGKGRDTQLEYVLKLID